MNWLYLKIDTIQAYAFCSYSVTLRLLYYEKQGLMKPKIELFQVSLELSNLYLLVNSM